MVGHVLEHARPEADGRCALVLAQDHADPVVVVVERDQLVHDLADAAHHVGQAVEQVVVRHRGLPLLVPDALATHEVQLRPERWLDAGDLGDHGVGLVGELHVPGGGLGRLDRDDLGAPLLAQVARHPVRFGPLLLIAGVGVGVHDEPGLRGVGHLADGLALEVVDLHLRGAGIPDDPGVVPLPGDEPKLARAGREGKDRAGPLRLLVQDAVVVEDALVHPPLADLPQLGHAHMGAVPGRGRPVGELAPVLGAGVGLHDGDPVHVGQVGALVWLDQHRRRVDDVEDLHALLAVDVLDHVHAHPPDPALGGALQGVEVGRLGVALVLDGAHQALALLGHLLGGIRDGIDPDARRCLPGHVGDAVHEGRLDVVDEGGPALSTPLILLPSPLVPGVEILVIHVLAMDRLEGVSPPGDLLLEVLKRLRCGLLVHRGHHASE